MYGFCLLIQSSMCFTDCLLFGTIVSATDPGKGIYTAYIVEGLCGYGDFYGYGVLYGYGAFGNRAFSSERFSKYIIF